MSCYPTEVFWPKEEGSAARKETTPSPKEEGDTPALHITLHLKAGNRVSHGPSLPGTLIAKQFYVPLHTTPHLKPEQLTTP